MRTIQASDLRDLIESSDGKISIVNTLPKESFDKTKIPGAINIPQTEPDFVDRVEEAIGGKSQPVVVYCASSKCDSSEQAAEKLDNAKFANVFDFAAGAEGWKSQQ